MLYTILIHCVFSFSFTLFFIPCLILARNNHQISTKSNTPQQSELKIDNTKYIFTNTTQPTSRPNKLKINTNPARLLHKHTNILDTHTYLKSLNETRNPNKYENDFLFTKTFFFENIYAYIHTYYVYNQQHTNTNVVHFEKK